MASKPGKGESEEMKGVMDSEKRVGLTNRGSTGVRELSKSVYQRQ